MKTVYVNSLINLLENEKSKLQITEFNEDSIVIDQKRIYFFQKDDEKYHFSLKEEDNSIYIEFRSSEIKIDPTKVLDVKPGIINYKTILPIVSPSDKENIKILLIFLLSENIDKIKKDTFTKNLAQVHSHANISPEALQKLFAKSIEYLEKYLKGKKNKIAFTTDEIIIKYSLKDIDKIAASLKKESLKKEDIKIFEQL